MANTISVEIYKKLNDAKNIATLYPYKSYIMSKEAYQISKKNKLKEEEGYSLIGMSLACRAKSEINKMLDYSYKALNIFETLQEPLGQIKALNLIGIAYFYNSMYEEAFKYLLQVVDLLHEYENNFLLSCVLNNIGEVFRESAKYENALEYYYSSLKICKENNFKTNQASIFGNIGEIYFLENKYEDALEYYTKSYEILLEEKDMVLLGEIENKLGKVHYISGNYSKSEDYLFSALSRLENLNNKFYAIDVLVNIAKLQWERNTKKSFYYFEKAIKYAEKINARKKLSEVCKIVAEYNENIGNFKVALEYYKKYCRVNEEIMTSNMGKKLEILMIELNHSKENSKFEKIKKLLEIEIVNQRKELENIKKSNEILEKKAFEDELTGIPNRRSINIYLNNAWKKTLLYDEVIVLFIIDIDDFKKYNDYWGHSKGDECLIKVANCMKNIQLKQKDFLGRYGGEEFIYYTSNVNYDQALMLGNLIRNEVEKLDLNYNVDNESKFVTISVGGVFGKASYFNGISNMVQIADEELYKAKNMGRNLTVLKNVFE